MSNFISFSFLSGRLEFLLPEHNQAPTRNTRLANDTVQICFWAEVACGATLEPPHYGEPPPSVLFLDLLATAGNLLSHMERGHKFF
jgi:hypothetical protein